MAGGESTNLIILLPLCLVLCVSGLILSDVSCLAISVIIKFMVLIFDIIFCSDHFLFEHLINFLFRFCQF